MKQISYNDPNRTKERQEVEPLTSEEIQEAVSIINALLHINESYSNPDENIREESLLQRLIWDYENKCHYFSVKGGWGQTGDIEVNYEIVKDANQ